MSRRHVVDVIDYSSPQATVARPATDYGADWAYTYLIGENPRATIVVIHAEDTLSDVVRHIENTCQAKGRMDLIRFNGHGHAGSLLHGELTELTAVSDQRTLSRLRRFFNRGAEAYLLNCSVGQRHGLLVSLARAWGVPVTAAVELQMWGRDRSTVRFEGPTRTGHPDGRVELDRADVPRDPNPHTTVQPPGPIRL